MLITLNEWAARNFGETRPSLRTMRRWVTEGKLYPSAIKVGRTLFVDSTAQYRGTSRAALSRALESARGQRS